jgi:uncharacterized protein YdhG (YjbR/CyaY superfamily)
MAKAKSQTIDEYISAFPKEIAEKLEQIRQLIREVAPDAEETISYDMPTFNLNGSYLIYFGGWKKHIALYPVSVQLAETLKEELSGYKGTKGSVHFPLDKPLPLDLIRKIVVLRLAKQ